MDNSY